MSCSCSKRRIKFRYWICLHLKLVFFTCNGKKHQKNIQEKNSQNNAKKNFVFHCHSYSVCSTFEFHQPTILISTETIFYKYRIQFMYPMFVFSKVKHPLSNKKGVKKRIFPNINQKYSNLSEYKSHSCIICPIILVLNSKFSMWANQ